MRILSSLLIFVALFGGCKNNTTAQKPSEEKVPEVVKTQDYKLYKAEKEQGLLILFPCYPCDAANTEEEFKILDKSLANGISVLYMNFNQKLYLTDSEKNKLSQLLSKIIEDNKLIQTNVFIGGFSSGGNVSLLIADYLIKMKSNIKPTGVFIVDSPIDLLGLYDVSIKNLEANLNEDSVAESRWIIESLSRELGNPSEGIENYERVSPYTYKTENVHNLSGLKNIKIRLYTEPDLNWWKEKNRNKLENLNAFYIKNLSEKLTSEFDAERVEYIATENKGYRANGVRHPHSWSIVDVDDLIDWMKK